MNPFAESTLEAAIGRVEMVIAFLERDDMQTASRRLLRKAHHEMSSTLNLLRMQEHLERATSQKPGPLLSLVTR